MNLAKAIKFSILTTLTLSATAFSLKRTTRPLATHCMWTTPPNNFPRDEHITSPINEIAQIANQYLSESRQILLPLKPILIEGVDEAASNINMMAMRKLSNEKKSDITKKHEQIFDDYLEQGPIQKKYDSQNKTREDQQVNIAMRDFRNLI